MYHLTGVTTRERSGRDPVRALDGIDLYVEDGGALVVRGAAGAGKSTLLRVLGGLERPSRGSVELDGTDLATLTECRLARIRTESIGTVPNGGGLAPGCTARQNVASALIPLRLLPADRWELAGEALWEVGVDGRSDLPAAELGASARQRVALARALVKRPTVLLADRPTAGLAGAGRKEIIELFVRLWGERRLTCVVATDDAELARRAPRLATMSDGRVASIGRYPSAATGG
ncbi:ABC transporter ATP-binding protein [Streptomyces sp. NPDC048650]|uniref:ABC transporter ATP-binding protein n=1 Tax=unclassified Streptomyces TaxID=2593676 RepID=UPI0037216DCB